jgi:nitrogen fixation protein FixH
METEIAFENTFDGMVILNDWIALPNGRQALGIAGHITCYDAEKEVGIRPPRGDATWIAKIEGSSGTIHVFGCQIRAIWEGKVKDEVSGNHVIL